MTKRLILALRLQLKKVMPPTSKKVIFLIFLGFLFTQEIRAQTSSSLKIQDFQLYKNTEQGEIAQFYTYIFKKQRMSFYTFLSPLDLTASLSEKIAYQTRETSSSQDSLKSIGSYMRSFLKDSITSTYLAQAEAASPSEISLATVPLLSNKMNILTPELKAGSDYIKPGLSVKNILNTHVHTNVSYHAQEETLETRFFKQLSKTVGLELTNTNTFTGDQVKKVLLGLSYQF